MKLRALPFVDFAYGDKRKDKSVVKKTIADTEADYDPATDRYKIFRERLAQFEEGSSDQTQFLRMHESVTSSKSEAYRILAKNYLELKEDHGLIWDGPQRVRAQLDCLQITASWYLHTAASNQRRIIFLNFRKEPLPTKQERGLLTLLQAASPDSAGVGVLNVQPATLVVATRLDVEELRYLESRAKRFCTIAHSL